MSRRFDVYELIALIRPRPAMYIGDHSLACLRSFLDGCFFLAEEYGIEISEHPSFGGFCDWVAEHFGWYESTAGWCNIIVEECGADQSKALDRFFEVIEEYTRRGDIG